MQPQDIDRILTDWQDESYHKRLSEREAAYESDKITDRMFEESDRLMSQRAAQAASHQAVTSFEDLQPEDVKIRELHRREEADLAWEQLERNPRLRPSEIGQLLEKKGLGEVAVRDGEVVSPESDRELQEIERARKSTKHASNVHHSRTKRPTTLWRPKGSIQRDTADNDQKVKTERQLRGDIQL